MEKERKEETKRKEMMMSIETKTDLIAIGLLLISLTFAFLVAYSDQFSDSNSILDVILGGILGVIFGGISGVIFGVISGGISGGILGGIWGGILGGIFGGIFGVILGVISGVISGGILGGIWGVIFGGIFGGIFGVIFGGGKSEQKISESKISLLFAVLLLPFSIITSPLSKYYNYQQLERDQKIVEILQVRVSEDGAEVLLPDKYVGENSYLKKVLSLGWKGEENKKRWKDIAVSYQEDKKYWFYAKLPFPASKTEAAIEIFFDHAYHDFTAIKEVSLKQ